MIKLDILNMNGFLETVNKCEGAVNVLHQDGKKENINKQYGIQNSLLKKYRENKDSLRLCLEIPTPRDYMRIVFFSIGLC